MLLFLLCFYRPQTKFAKVMFLQVSVILSTGGACVVAQGGVHGCSGGMHGCLGGMHGCSGGRGACMVAPGGMRGCSGGHVWLLLGGMRGCSRGACMVALGGHAQLLPGGHAWLLPGGVHGCSWGGMCGCSWGACVVAPGGGMCGFFDEIWSMSGRYASYWNAYLFNLVITVTGIVNTFREINSFWLPESLGYKLFDLNDVLNIGKYIFV